MTDRERAEYGRGYASASAALRRGVSPGWLRREITDHMDSNAGPNAIAFGNGATAALLEWIARSVH